MELEWYSLVEINITGVNKCHWASPFTCMKHVARIFLLRPTPGAAVLKQCRDRSHLGEIGEGNRSYRVIVHAGPKAMTHFSVGRISQRDQLKIPVKTWAPYVHLCALQGWGGLRTSHFCVWYQAFWTPRPACCSRSETCRGAPGFQTLLWRAVMIHFCFFNWKNYKITNVSRL